MNCLIFACRWQSGYELFDGCSLETGTSPSPTTWNESDCDMRKWGLRRFCSAAAGWCGGTSFQVGGGNACFLLLVMVLVVFNMFDWLILGRNRHSNPRRIWSNWNRQTSKESYERWALPQVNDKEEKISKCTHIPLFAMILTHYCRWHLHE